MAQLDHRPDLFFDTRTNTDKAGKHLRILKRTVQSVVVVFKVLQLQEVSGPLAALLCCRCEVGALGWGGAGARWLLTAGQVFGRGLVLLARRGAAMRLDTVDNGGKGTLFPGHSLTFHDGISIIRKAAREKFTHAVASSARAFWYFKNSASSKA